MEHGKTREEHIEKLNNKTLITQNLSPNYDDDDDKMICKCKPMQRKEGSKSFVVHNSEFLFQFHSKNWRNWFEQIFLYLLETSSKMSSEWIEHSLTTTYGKVEESSKQSRASSTSMLRNDLIWNDMMVDVSISRKHSQKQCRLEKSRHHFTRWVFSTVSKRLFND